jgi:Mrp family chromosome partitioning ATPase
MSNKRGVGKTSLATSLAVALSKRKIKVGLIDLDLHGTDNLKMLSLERSYEIGENKRVIPKLFSDYLKIISIQSIKQNLDHDMIRTGDLRDRVIGQFVIWLIALHLINSI